MPQPDIFGAYVKVERAVQHIDDLQSLIDTFLTKPCPYEASGYLDSETGEYVIDVNVLRLPPPMIGAVAGDAAHNLRSALDLLMHQLDARPDDQTAFPIVGGSVSRRRGDGKSRRNRGSPTTPTQRFESVMERMEKKGTFDPIAIDLLKEIKPYEGGNAALWQLHRLDITDKHHVLIPGMTSAEGVFIHDVVPPAPGETRFLDNMLIDRESQLLPRTKGHAEFMRLPVGTVTAEMDVYPDFICEVAFIEPEVVEGEAMLPCLTRLRKYVESVLQAFAIALRLG